MKKAFSSVFHYAIADPFFFKLTYLIVLLFNSIPFVHEYVGRALKLFILWGFLIVVYDLFKRKQAFTGRYSLFLFLFVAAYGLTTLVNYRSGLSGNIAIFCYISLYFFVLYRYDVEAPRKKLLHEMKLLMSCTVVIAFAFSLFSFLTFLLSVSKSYLIDGIPMIVGIAGNRLWGLYNPNVGATINFVTIVFSLLLFAQTKKKLLRAAHGCNILLQYCCLVLTQSRSYAGVLVVFAMLFAFQCVRRHWRADHVKKALRVAVHIGVPVLVAVLLFAAESGAKFVLPRCAVLFQEHNVTMNLPESTGRSPLVIEREDVGGGGTSFLTGRAQIWESGWKAFQQNPVLGVGRENVYAEASPFLEDVGNLDHVRAAGLHNLYLMLLVCSGVVGFVILGAFAGLSIKDFLPAVFRKKTPLLTFTLIIFLLSTYAVEFVEARIVYEVTFPAAVFWIFYGYVTCLLEQEPQTKDPARIHRDDRFRFPLWPSSWNRRLEEKSRENGRPEQAGQANS